MHRAGAAVSLLLILGLAGQSCFGVGSETTEVLNPRDDTRSIPLLQLSSEPVTLDPSRAEDGLSLFILGNMMEGLMGYDSKGFLEPRLAESYRVSQDGKTFEFKLRPGLKWSDGMPIDADQFVLSIERALRPGTGSKLAALFLDIRGAADFYSGKNPNPKRLGVRAKDGLLTIELERKIPYFLHLCTLFVLFPLRADVLERNHGTWPELGPVTGPYRMIEHVRDQRYRFLRNPNDTVQPARSDEVDLLVVADESTAARMFDSNALDVLTRIPSFDFDRYLKRNLIVKNPFLATNYLAFNVKKPPFDQLAYRQAVAGSIDKEALVTALGSNDLPATSWIPPGLEGYQPFQDSRKKDFSIRAVNEVKKRLVGSTSSVEASFDTSGRNSTLMEKIQADLQSSLGLRLDLNPLEWKSYVKKLQTDAPPLYRFGWLSPIYDPVPHLQAFVSGNPNNYTGWSNLEYDRRVRAIESMSPGSERKEAVLAAEKILTETDAVVIPLYHYVLNHAVSPKLTGYHSNSFGVIRWSDLEKRQNVRKNDSE
jgi:oligopeptide transport system substrate-binding protein